MGAGREVGVQVDGPRSCVFWLPSLAQASLSVLVSVCFQEEMRLLCRSLVGTTNYQPPDVLFLFVPVRPPVLPSHGDGRIGTRPQLSNRPGNTDLGQGLLAGSSDDRLSVGIFCLAQGLTVEAHGRE